MAGIDGLLQRLRVRTHDLVVCEVVPASVEEDLFHGAWLPEKLQTLHSMQNTPNDTTPAASMWRKESRMGLGRCGSSSVCYCGYPYLVGVPRVIARRLRGSSWLAVASTGDSAALRSTQPIRAA
jgi:hypothetical protein